MVAQTRKNSTSLKSKKTRKYREKLNSGCVNVPVKVFNNIFNPGTYKGKGVYSPTKKYSNGLATTNTLIIKKGKNNASHFTNTIVAKDKKTNKVEYTAIRKGIFFYKSNKQLFMKAKSYINNKVVSSQYGCAKSITDDTIQFSVKSKWYIDGKKNNNVIKTLTRKGDKLLHTIKDSFTMKEEYKVAK